jgi:hypothetical protein
MAGDSKTIELSRSELREVAGYAVECAPSIGDLRNVYAPTIGTHEPRSCRRQLDTDHGAARRVLVKVATHTDFRG